MSGEHLTVGTWHCEIGGGDVGRYEALNTAAQHISVCVATAPDLLGWTAAEWLLEEPNQLALRHMTKLLSGVYQTIYEPFPTRRTRRRGATVLFVNRGTLEVNEWGADPSQPKEFGWLGVTLWADADPAWVSAQHWDGSCDSDFWPLHAGVYRRGDEPALLLGQLSQTSTWSGEVRCDFEEETANNADLRSRFGSNSTEDDRWEPRTLHVDKLRSKYRDAGEQANVGAPTRNTAPWIRTDRIMWTQRLGAEVVPGTYRAHPTNNLRLSSPHRLTTVQLRQKGPSDGGGRECSDP